MCQCSSPSVPRSRLPDMLEGGTGQVVKLKSRLGTRISISHISRDAGQCHEPYKLHDMSACSLSFHKRTSAPGDAIPSAKVDISICAARYSSTEDEGKPRNKRQGVSRDEYVQQAPQLLTCNPYLVGAVDPDCLSLGTGGMVYTISCTGRQLP